MTIDNLLAEQRLLICVGAGGVGKTSVAAALGLKAARMGRKVLVLTIDPAKRLANSLGLKRFGNDETQINLDSIEDGSGELWAMMLDGKRTFDELIRRIAKDPKKCDDILNNNIYKGITDTIVGNQEYMATEKLYDVVASGRYDLVILDTPPVKNALDFLDSPGRMTRFVDKRIMKWFLKPYDENRVFGKFLAGTSAALFRLLGYVFGREFLEDISVFFQSFRDLYEGFQERHHAVEKMFREKNTSFLIVSSPGAPPMEVASFFLGELKNRNMPNPGVIVNQRHFSVEETLDPKSLLTPHVLTWSEPPPDHVLKSLLARLGMAHRRLQKLNQVESGFVEELREKISKNQMIWSVPRLQGEVHDLQALAKVGDMLCDQ